MKPLGGWRDQRDRPRLRISVRGAARELHGCSRTVQQRAEPADAALHGDEPLGRALQGGAHARQINLFSSQRSGCSETGSAGRCTPVRRLGPHPARRDAVGAQPAARPSGGAIRASPAGRLCWSPPMKRPVRHGQRGKASSSMFSTAIFRRSPMRAGGFGRGCRAV